MYRASTTNTSSSTSFTSASSRRDNERNLARHPLSVYEKKQAVKFDAHQYLQQELAVATNVGVIKSSNPFAALANDNVSNKVATNKQNKHLLNKIKQQQKDEDDCVYVPSMEPKYAYPRVQLTTWTGTRMKPPSPIFEDEEDETQVGPEMRRIYNYLEKVYQQNLHRDIYSNNESYGGGSEDECQSDGEL